jgi:hypothetical protein
MRQPRRNVATLEARLIVQLENRRAGKPLYPQTVRKLARDCEEMLEIGTLNRLDFRRVRAVLEGAEALAM